MAEVLKTVLATSCEPNGKQPRTGVREWNCAVPFASVKFRLFTKIGSAGADGPSRSCHVSRIFAAPDVVFQIATRSSTSMPSNGCFENRWRTFACSGKLEGGRRMPTEVAAILDASVAEIEFKCSSVQFPGGFSVRVATMDCC